MFNGRMYLQGAFKFATGGRLAVAPRTRARSLKMLNDKINDFKHFKCLKRIICLSLENLLLLIKYITRLSISLKKASHFKVLELY